MSWLNRQGAAPKTFIDLALVVIYFLFVAYVVIKVGLFVFRTALSIFCCVFCCGCCRSKKEKPTSAKGNAQKKGQVVTKQMAAPKKSPTKK